ncbi:MAG: hypothetical protein IJH34_13400 [Romboutsia sp.]|nr:hypothetical protein [Romboutsia sp.]
MKQNYKINKSTILRDSLLTSFIFTTIIFIGLFLVFFIKSNNIFTAFKYCFPLSLCIFIALSIIIYVFIDDTLNARLKELNDFNNTFDNSKQKEIENKQKEILNKLSQYESNNNYSSINELNNGVINSNKSSNFNAKTQFNADFELDANSLSNKMDN